MDIRRHFISVKGRFGQRQVHYRRGGHGPLVVLLHQSPQSSRELVPLMTEWAEDFTVIAPDSPGYGLSDPLGVEKASLDDFAEALIEFFDALGIRRAGIYGFHTGGMIGIALGHRHPERIAGVACNGVAVLTDEERTLILKDYLPPFVPRWDGGHLAWLWGRMREQAIFFPWHAASEATRMDFPMPPAARLHAGVLEFLRAADHYHVAYRAAFEYRAEEALRETTTPTLLTAAAWDPISPHLQRLTKTAQPVHQRPAADPGEALTRSRDFLAAHPGDDAFQPVQHVPDELRADRLHSAIVRTSFGALRIRYGGVTDKRPVLLVHGAGKSARSLDAMAFDLARFQSVVVADLPGHGEADDGLAVPPRLTDLSIWFEELLQELNLRRVAVVGVDGGAINATAIALNPRTAARVDRLLLVNPPLPGDDQRAVARAGIDRDGVDWYGGHLLRAWHTVRDGRLYEPWCRRDPAGIRRHGLALDPVDIQREVTELLKADGNWQSLLADQWDYALDVRLASPALNGRITLAAVPGWPYHRAADALAVRLGLNLVELGPEPRTWGAPIAPHLD